MVCLAITLAGVLIVNSSCIYTPDSARYLVWAKSLASLDGFKDTTQPEPSRYVVHAPLYPILIAPIVRLFAYNIIAVKIGTLCFGLLTCILFYRWISGQVGRRTAVIACMFLGFSPMFLVYSTEVLSDMPFAACAVLTMILFDRMASNDSNPWLLLAVSAAITAGILLRELGFSLFFMAVAVLIVRKQWKQAALIAVLPIAMYGIWYVRNELIIAPSESPDITNAKLFTHHFYTLPGASLMSELGARVVNNGLIYAAGVGKLLSVPFYKYMQYDVVFLSRSPLAVVAGILSIAVYPIVLLTLGSMVFGIVLDLRQSSTAVHRLAFLFFYLAIVLVYPVNDIRFMVPMLLLMIYYCALSFDALLVAIPKRDKPSIVLKLSPVVALSLLLIPNLVWDAQFISNSHAYRTAPLSFYESTAGMRQYPSHFTMPFDLAGAWIAGHSDSSAVILSQWKDLACWTEGRKVFTADNTLPLDDLENAIRDYNVHYLVVVRQKNGIREFEVQMLLSRKFAFVEVQRFANVEIMRVQRKEVPSRTVGDGTIFTRGISLLDAGSYGEAIALLDSAYRQDDQNMPALFYFAVAKEFNAGLVEARDLFSSIRLRPQSLVFLNEAAIHQQLIGELADLEQSSDEQKAEHYVRVGARYWNLGYRTHARSMIRKALECDSTFFPAMIFGMHFALSENDTLGARNYLLHAGMSHADSGLVNSWKNIFSAMEHIKKARTPEARSQDCMIISNAFYSMGIVESAIDNAWLALNYDRNNVEALKLLSHMYQKKHRFAPARQVLERARLLEPQNAAIARELSAVLTHF